MKNTQISINKATATVSKRESVIDFMAPPEIYIIFVAAT
jgi:hypothetical protein